MAEAAVGPFPGPGGRRRAWAEPHPDHAQRREGERERVEGEGSRSVHGRHRKAAERGAEELDGEGPDELVDRVGLGELVVRDELGNDRVEGG